MSSRTVVLRLERLREIASPLLLVLFRFSLALSVRLLVARLSERSKNYVILDWNLRFVVGKGKAVVT